MQGSRFRRTKIFFVFPDKCVGGERGRLPGISLPIIVAGKLCVREGLSRCFPEGYWKESFVEEREE